MNTLTLDDIDQTCRGNIKKQSYDKPMIDGVKIISLPTFLSEDGSFTEILRFDDQLFCESFPDFHVLQINRSVMLPQTVKAWHLHLGQDEVWNVGTNSRLLVGLWDLRASSPTKAVTMRIPLSHEKVVYIPRGVAHGAANHCGQTAEILYFMSSRYSKESPDEQRLPWDSLEKEFWEIKRE